MFTSAASPNRSRSCSRYRLAGITAVPGESKIPDGRLAAGNGFPYATDAPVHGAGRLLDQQIGRRDVPRDGPADVPAMPGPGRIAIRKCDALLARSGVLP